MAELWASIPAHVILGLVAGLPVILWDWRIALPGLLVVQIGISGLIGAVYGLSAPWPAVHLSVLFVAFLILCFRFYKPVMSMSINRASLVPGSFVCLYWGSRL